MASCGADGLDAADPAADLDDEEALELDEEALELDEEALEHVPNRARPKDGEKKKCRAFV